MAIDGNYDGQIRINKKQGITQAIRDELGLSANEAKKLGSSIWKKILEQVDLQNCQDKASGQKGLKKSKKKYGYHVTTGQVIKFSAEIWNRIVDIVNKKLNKTIGKLKTEQSSKGSVAEVKQEVEESSVASSKNDKVEQGKDVKELFAKDPNPPKNDDPSAFEEIPKENYRYSLLNQDEKVGYIKKEVDEKGNLVKLVDYNLDGVVEGYDKREYDENNNMTTLISYSPDGQVQSCLLLEYDESGLITKDKYYDSCDSCLVREFENGKKIIKSYTEKNCNGIITTTNLVEYGEEIESDLSKDDAQNYITDDMQGSETNKTEILSNGTKITSVYNNQGKEISRTETYSNGNYSISIFDDSGNSIRSEYYDCDGNLEEIIKCEYDANKNCIKERIYNSDEIMHFYIAYEYDDQGNQISCTHYNPDGTEIDYDTFYGVDENKSEGYQSGEVVNSGLFAHGPNASIPLNVLQAQDEAEITEEQLMAELSHYKDIPEEDMKLFGPAFKATSLNSELLVKDINIPVVNGKLQPNSVKHSPYRDLYPPSSDPNPPTEKLDISQGDNIEYDDKGNVIKFAKTKSNGSVSAYIASVYSDKKQLEMDVKYTPEGKVMSYSRYKYDQEGKELERVAYASDGSVKNYVKNEYGTDGKLSKLIIYNSDGSVKEYRTFEYINNSDDPIAHFFMGDSDKSFYSTKISMS